MALYAYPPEFPTSDVLNLIIEAVKGHSLDYKEAAHAAWHVAGFGLSQWDVHAPPVIGDAPVTDEQTVTMLENMKFAQGAGAIPWNILLPILLDLVQRFLRK